MSDLVVLLPDFVAHVAVGEVKAGQHHGLQLRLPYDAAVNAVPHQQVDKHYVGWIDKCNIL